MFDFNNKNVIVSHIMYNKCQDCIEAEKLFKKYNFKYIYINANVQDFEVISQISGSKIIPQIFFSGNFIGGLHNLKNLLKELNLTID